jgi:response regulator RpfG family c-di-GMP phosphodiesterase
MIKKILLVEEHPNFRQFMGAFLCDYFEVMAASNSMEAMAWIQKGYIPDCIVAEADAKNECASDLLQMLQCTGMYAHIPVVVIGKMKHGNDGDQYRLLGAAKYFSKPFNPVFLKNYLLQQAAA